LRAVRFNSLKRNERKPNVVNNNKINTMIRRAFLIIFVIGCQIQSYSQSYKIQDSVKRIVFLGNSITYQGTYIEYIEAYMTINYPERHFEFINMGLPSETVSGLTEPNHAEGRFPRPDLHERLDRILSKTKPDLVLACYGMNDGIYMPYDDNRFEKFKKGINWLHEEVQKFGVPIIHITPPIYDERKGAAYANVLDLYSDWLLSNRYTSNWDVIDIHWPMKKYLEEQRLKDASFVFAKDGIHPNNIGHFLMAKYMLLYFSETELAKATNIETAFSKCQHGKEILRDVEKRQRLMKDSWLTWVGHKRPDMKVGLPMPEALQKSDEIRQHIQILLKQNKQE